MYILKIIYLSFGGDAQKIKFFTFDSPKFILNFNTKTIQNVAGFNFTIKRIKRNKGKKHFKDMLKNFSKNVYVMELIAI